MAQKIIPNFIYKDESKKLGLYLKKEYPTVHLRYFEEKKELIIISKNGKILNSVYNQLLIINRFDLKI